MADMAYRLLGNLFVLAHNEHPPPESLWQAYLADVRRQQDLCAMRTLVYTHGGGPTPAQRAELNMILCGRRSRVSVVASSPGARGIVGALGLLNPEIRVFNPGEAQAAFGHLGLGMRERMDAESIARMLRGAVAKPLRATTA